jgi:predicted phage terminase large subunit-like protein
MSIIKIPIADLDKVITVDLAVSESAKASRTAVVCAGVSPMGKFFILDMWVKRTRDHELTITKTLDMAREWMVRLIGVEANAWQKVLLPYMQRTMKERQTHYPIIELKPDRNTKTVEKKDQRIMSMQPFFKAGQVHIMRGMLDFIEEYETFPLARTKDILDALAYAFRLLAPKTDIKPVPGAIQRLQQSDPQSARYWKSLAIKRGIMEPDPDPDELDDVVTREEQFTRGVGELV